MYSKTCPHQSLSQRATLASQASPLYNSPQSKETMLCQLSRLFLLWPVIHATATWELPSNRSFSPSEPSCPGPAPKRAQSQLRRLPTSVTALTDWRSSLKDTRQRLSSKKLLAADADREQRQIGIVDDQGQAVAHTGSGCWAGHQTGDGFTCQGNVLAGAGVLEAMASRFVETEGELAERLSPPSRPANRLVGIGGDANRRRSMLRGREAPTVGSLDRYIDLRVDDHPDPIDELARLLQLHRFYLTRPSAQDFLADRSSPGN